nr:MFS transporter [Paenalcaligenes hominis]
MDDWPLYPLMMKDLNLDYQDLGNIMGILGLAWGASSLFAGRLADRIGRRKVLIPATILFSLMTGLTGVATGLTSLLIIRFMMGLSEGAFGPTSVALTAEASKPSRRGLNMGIQQSTFALLGIGLGPIIVTQMVQYLPSWHWVFVIMTLPGLVLAYFMHKTIREPKHLQQTSSTSVAPEQNSPVYTYKDLFQYRNILVGIVCMCCVMTCVFILSAMSPVYFTNYLQLSVSQMGFVTSGIGFGAFAGQVIIPALSDRFGRKSVTVIALLIAALLLYQFIHTPAQPLTLFLLLFFIAFGANSCLCMIGGTIAVESVPLALGSTAVGLIIGIGEIFGGGVAPMLAGWIAQSYGIQYTMYLALAGLIGCCFFALFFKETAPIKVGKPVAVA